MKQLLEHQFAEHYDPEHKDEHVVVETLSNEYKLRDEHACSQCIPFFTRDCERETFLLHAENSVSYINIEDFINGFQSLDGRQRCDALFYDEHKLVLMDMYCGMSEYVDEHLCDKVRVVGKKTIVREQIESLISILYEVDAVAQCIDEKVSKIGIFGYREKDAELFLNVPRKVNHSMEAFFKMTKAANERRLKLPMSHGFQYIMNAYPKVYEW